MNKIGHEAKQDMEVPPEFVANDFNRERDVSGQEYLMR